MSNTVLAKSFVSLYSVPFAIIAKLIASIILIQHICDYLSENPPSLHLPAIQEIPFQNFILKKTSFALVVDSFTEHNT